jgi:hypothetical protein
VVGVVAENEVAGSCQSAENAKVGLVARRKEKHGLHIQKCGEGGFKLTVFGQIAGDQAGRASAKSGTRDGSGCRGSQGRVA